MASFFSRLFSSSKKNQGVLGIDIGSSAIKVVQLSKKHNHALLETYGEITLGPYGGAPIGQAVKLNSARRVEALVDLLHEMSATTTDAALAIPFASSLLTTIKLPQLEGEQLNRMIGVEARKHIPVPMDEVMLDWSVISGKDSKSSKENNSSSNMEVLLVAIHNRVLTNYTDIVKGSGLASDFFEIEIFSSIRSSIGDTDKPTAIIDFGAATTKVYIVEHGIIRTSHIINRGSQDITKNITRELSMPIAESEKIKRTHDFRNTKDTKGITQISLSTLDYIFSESSRVLLSYQEKFGKEVPSVVLTGGGAVMRGMLEIGQERLLASVALSDPFSNVSAPKELNNTLRKIGPGFSVAIGVALRKLQEL